MKFFRIALLGAVFALVAGGCGDEGNVFSLSVGDCFTSIEATEISDVPLVDCSEPHEHEVYAIWNIGDTLPSQDSMNQGCVDRFEDAIGLPFEDSEIYAFAITPTADSFDSGDREVICYSAEPDESGEVAQVTGSVLGSNR
jgi:hypothetical protein